VIANIQIPLRKLFLWLSVYACFFAIVAGLPVPTFQIIAAFTVVTAFVIMDSRSAPDSRHEVPALARCSIVLAYYASAFALTVAVCFGLDQFVPEALTPPEPPPTFFATVYYITSGQLFVDIVQAIERQIMIGITYYQLFAVFSAIAFCSSLFGLRHLRSAKWFLLLSSPGMCLFAFFIIAAILDSVEG